MHIFLALNVERHH